MVTLKPPMAHLSAPPRRHRPSPGSHSEPVQAVLRVPAHLARRFHQVCLGVISEVAEPAGLTPLQYAALVALDEWPGIDQRTLAARLAMDPVSAGQLIAELERLGLAERRAHPFDRRALSVRLSPPGLRLRRRLRPHMLAANDRILAPLAPEERTQLIGLLARVVEANEAYATPGNGRRRPMRRAAARSRSTR